MCLIPTPNPKSRTQIQTPAKSEIQTHHKTKVAKPITKISKISKTKTIKSRKPNRNKISQMHATQRNPITKKLKQNTKLQTQSNITSKRKQSAQIKQN